MREIIIDLDSIATYLKQPSLPEDIVSISDKRALKQLILEVAHKLHRTMCDKKVPHRLKGWQGLKCSREVWRKLTVESVVAVLNTVGYTASPSTVTHVLVQSKRDII